MFINQSSLILTAVYYTKQLKKRKQDYQWYIQIKNGIHIDLLR